MIVKRGVAARGPGSLPGTGHEGAVVAGSRFRVRGNDARVRVRFAFLPYRRPFPPLRPFPARRPFGMVGRRFPGLPRFPALPASPPSTSSNLRPPVRGTASSRRTRTGIPMRKVVPLRSPRRVRASSS